MKKFAEEAILSIAKKSACLLERYKITDDVDVLQNEVNGLYLDLAVARYELPRTVYINIRSFIDHCLNTVVELKSFSQFSTDIISVYKNGVMDRDKASVEAETFAEYTYDYIVALNGRIVDDVYKGGNYYEDLMQILKGYYVRVMCKLPVYDHEVFNDREAYAIVLEGLYPLLDNLIEKSLEATCD